MIADDWATSELLLRVQSGDDVAVDQLLQSYRDRLRAMVAAHLDRRLVARVDPSDIVQEALAEAASRLPDYLRQRPIPFYPWLRRMAWQTLVDLRRRHVGTQKRSVLRELPLDACPSDESIAALAECFVAKGSSPSARLLRGELHSRVHAALSRLSDRDREILVLRYVEQLPPREGAAALGISESNFTKRHLRAIERLRRQLDADQDGESQ